MSSKGTTKAATTKDVDFMFAVLESNRGPLQIDWEQVANKVNLKNGSTASVRFGQIKKKLGWTGSQGQTPGGANRVVKARSPAKPRAASTRGRKPAVKKSPTKGAGRGKGKKAKEESEDESEGEQSEDDKKAVDLMVASEDDEAGDDKAEESEEESFEARVSRGEYDDDDELDEGAGAQLQQETVQNEDEVEEEYDASDPDNAYYGVSDVMADAPSERKLYVPKHA